MSILFFRVIASVFLLNFVSFSIAFIIKLMLKKEVKHVLNIPGVQEKCLECFSRLSTKLIKLKVLWNFWPYNVFKILD